MAIGAMWRLALVTAAILSSGSALSASGALSWLRIRGPFAAGTPEPCSGDPRMIALREAAAATLHAVRKRASERQLSGSVHHSEDVGLIINLMATHGASAGVQEDAFGALCSLAATSQNQALIATSGGIEALMRGMGAHGSSAGVQAQGCSALCILAGNAVKP